MSICGLSLHQGTTDSRKNLEQRFIFQIGTLNPHGINEHFHSINLFLFFTLPSSTNSVARSSVYKAYTTHSSSICSDEGLTLETSAFQSLDILTAARRSQDDLLILSLTCRSTLTVCFSCFQRKTRDKVLLRMPNKTTWQNCEARQSSTTELWGKILRKLESFVCVCHFGVPVCFFFKKLLRTSLIFFIIVSVQFKV